MPTRRRLSAEEAQPFVDQLKAIVKDFDQNRQFPHNKHLIAAMGEKGFTIAPSHLAGTVAWAVELSKIAKAAQITALEKGITPQGGRGYGKAASVCAQERQELPLEVLQSVATVFRFVVQEREYRIVTAFDNVTHACHYTQGIAKFQLQRHDAIQQRWVHAAWLSVDG